MNPTDAMVDAALDDIKAERHRQISAEGWTPKHDDQHDKREIALAAGCYAIWAGGGRAVRRASRFDEQLIFVPRGWPWAPCWWKPTTPRRDLVKAAALIVAEIERLDRRTALEAALAVAEKTP